MSYPTYDSVRDYASQCGIKIDISDFLENHRYDDDWREILVRLTYRSVLCPKCGNPATNEHHSIYICAKCEPLSEFDDYYRFQYPTDTRAEIVDTRKMLDEIKRSMEYGAYNNNASNVA